jgi:thiol-disulfide isomerase/thioredoxin
VVWLEFWSSDCGACRGDHYWSLLARLDKELGPKGLVIIALHEAGVPKADVQEFLKDKDICYVVALDEEMEEGPGKTFTAYNAEGWPESHVIDKKGVRRGIGVPLTTDINELEPLATKLLEEDS